MDRTAEDVARRLRGSGTTDYDTNRKIAHMKVTSRLYSDSLQSIQKNYQLGDMGAAGAELRAVFEDTNLLSETMKNEEQVAGLNVPDSLGVIPESGTLSLATVTDTVLGEHIQPTIISKLVDFSGRFADALEALDLPSLGISAPRTEGSQHADHFTHTQVSGDDKSEHHLFTNHQIPLKHAVHHQHERGSSLPRVSNFFSARDQEAIMVNHQLRRDALGTCAPGCDLEDTSCLCERLFGCVRDMEVMDKTV